MSVYEKCKELKNDEHKLVFKPIISKFPQDHLIPLYLRQLRSPLEIVFYKSPMYSLITYSSLIKIRVIFEHTCLFQYYTKPVFDLCIIRFS